MKKGNRFGTHRVLEPAGVLPQPALRVDNNMDILYDNEILCDVATLNIDSSSFRQIKEEANGNSELMKKTILSIVERFGKHKNPVTGSGGMFVGQVNSIGDSLTGRTDLKPGDRIASLVSLSLTPLRIDTIQKIHLETDQVDIIGKAILFESAIWARLPDDMSEKLALAVFDVAGAPAQTAKLVEPESTVMILGGAGKSGLLCGAVARSVLGKTGSLIGVTSSDAGIKLMKESGYYDNLVQISATNAVGLYEETGRITDSRLCDLVISTVNAPDCEMGAILSCREGGTVYFFSMATSFTKAALGAEGVGRDVAMIIGNGYTAGHAETTLELIRRDKFLRELYQKRYC